MPSLMDRLVAVIAKTTAANDNFAKTADQLTSDYSQVVDLRFDTMVTLYGGYKTPLIQRLKHAKAQTITHYYRDRAVRASTANAQAEGGTPTERSTVPDRRTNTCQIVSGMVDVSGSAIQEAENGVYGDNLRDLLKDQLEAEMQGILKDVERAMLLGTESTSDPRAMWGLENLSGINTTDVGGTALGTANIDAAVEECVDDTEEVPTALYVPTGIVAEMASWAIDRVRIQINAGEDIAAQLRRIPAGQAVGFYMSPFGPLEIVRAPEIAYSSGTAASNQLFVVNEELLRVADFRTLRREPWVTTEDALTAAIIWEGCLEARVPTAHNRVHNWLRAADA